MTKMSDTRNVSEQHEIHATSQSELPDSRKKDISPPQLLSRSSSLQPPPGGNRPLLPPTGNTLGSPCSNPDATSRRHVRKFSRYIEARNTVSVSQPQPLSVSAERPNKRLRHRSSSPQPRALGDTTFQYHSLNSQKHEIRLLRILSDVSTKIRCQIFHTSLDMIQDYIAISYSWGDPLETRVIELDGHQFPVTTSLWHALSRIRSISTSVIVWADAICINQLDDEERSYQVGLMTSIYKKASMVALWLGPEANDSYAATELLCELAECNNSRTALAALINNRKHKRDWQALVDLFERDYWRRLWVVQEIFNARQVTVFCGNSAHSWDIYLQASKLLRACKVDLMRAFHLEKGRQALSLRSVTYVDCLVGFGPSTLQSLHSLHNAGSADLFSCLLLCADKLCRDPRDKLYALLGILPEKDQTQFQVNYKLDPRHVYTDIVDYLIAKTGSLDVICCASNPILTDNIHILPSWVPDWSNGSSWRKPLAWNFNRRFNASKDTKSSTYLSSRRRKLSITGIVLGTADYVGIGLEHAPSTSAYLMAFLQWYWVFTSYKSPLSDDDHESFCRTLSLNQFRYPSSTSVDVIGRTYQVFTRFLAQRYQTWKPDEILQRYTQATPEMSIDEMSQALENYFKPAMKGRKFVITTTGLFCLASDNTNANDIICIALGCSIPIILRQFGEEFKIVGDSFVDRYMYGQALDEERTGTRERKEFILI
ncbi:heterokaryon incompatibility protein-domain-containing protein [Fusarium oxysporum II5]|uniref:Heterokaryon incompatibility domain-containing protein n=2 Tax=Fusarium oxysporum species complex TaxID=171631 RepID=X0JAP3_FUSO5|nr:uncharacterized protein FOIG_13526 [Fusarium odoratissimum NRRL 54006]EXL93390.1 hypothetical protein FOIG_13526 [Fusarium odoratissimum NRRL 54006]KAK2135912.1 heterokaryon incompatibility protein-domain-containing protein [Fusarium oxysporum II5]